MPARKKIEKDKVPAVKSLAVIAGGGALPRAVLEACERTGIETFVVAFEGQTDPATVRGRAHVWTHPGQAGKIMKTLKGRKIKDIVLIGALRRPSFAEIKPDLKTAGFLAKLALKALGDDDFLGAIRQFIQKEGFNIHGAHKFAGGLLAPAGCLTKARPKKGDRIDIARGIEVTQALGALDIGQAAVVQEGMVLAVEGIEGTDGLLARVKDLKRKGRGGVLVKTCKPGQDRDIDLPTIGPETVKKAAAAGLAGIVVHAGQSLIIDRDEVVKLADRHKIFILGEAAGR